MTIPVVFSTDENYIFYTCVAITSLARSAAPGTEYDIHVLMGEEPGENAAALLGELRRRHPNIRVSTVRVDGARFRNVVINNGHVTRAAFYRLALADLLGVDRCIYLDSDILVTDDLSPLYLADLGDCCLAGCRDIWIDLMEETEREERRERADLPSMDGYVNSGVLVMDLGKIREEGLDEMFLRHAGRDYQYEDQDILNVCCYGRIRLLSARWNIFALFLGEERMLRESGISGDVLRQYQEKKGIIHYATPFTRPWEHSRYRACREWWEAAAEWEDTGQYRELYGRVCIRERQGKGGDWLGECARHEGVVIFGFTSYGREVCEWLLRAGLGDRLRFCDNDPEKREKTYKGIPVFPLAEIGVDGILFINASQGRSREVTEALVAHGAVEGDILHYRREKPPGYYRYLDEAYYLEELEDIFLREFGRGRGDFRPDLARMRGLLRNDLQYESWHARYRLGEWILKE